MTKAKPTEEVVDRLIAEHLDHQARQIDSSKLLTRIRMSRQLDRAVGDPQSPGVAAASVSSLPRAASSESEATGRRRHPLRGRGSWALLAGLALLLGFFGGRQLGPLTASASNVLRDLQVVHQTDVDRCYRVQYSPDPRYWDGSNKLEGPSHSILWTRGDRFWADCTIADIRLVIGRSEDGALWIRQSPERGMQLISDEADLPQEIALLCAVNSLTVPRLVDEVLADFELRVDSQGAPMDRSTTLVWASLKPGHNHPLIDSAVMEIDPESRSLRRLVLWMKRDGRPRGTVTYTFLKRGVQDDERYQLHSHLNADAEIGTHHLQTETD